MTDLLGAHMSIAGGLHRALWRGHEIACSVVQIFLVHLNDAKQPLGSGLDRHEKIGRGHLGRAAFRWLLNDRRFRGVPMVIETPKEPEPRADRQALKLLRSLRVADT
jgi:deoxyribonuclease IV